MWVATVHDGHMSEPPIGDPWIAAYLVFRRAVLDNEFETFADVEDYASQVTRGLPGATPSIPAAMFITADIGITFPERPAELMNALWVPR